MKLTGILTLLNLPIAALALSTSTFEVPGPNGLNGTAPQAISSMGDITGLSFDGGGFAHGFLLRKGVFSTIDYPGFVHTTPRGINNQGEVVGQIDNRPITDSTKPTSGFLLQEDGKFIKVDYPGATITGLF